MSRTVLYILSHELDRHSLTTFLRQEVTGCESVAVILLQDGVRTREVPCRKIFAVEEDVRDRGITVDFPLVSYAEVVERIFNSDHVVVL